MKITVCHKSGACTNLTADDYCHIEVDGVIVWYPEVDDRAPKSSEVANDSASHNTDYEAACLIYDEYICDLDPVAPKNFRTWCEQRLNQADKAPDIS